MDRQLKAYLLAGTAVLIWSTVATAFKVSLRSLDPYTMLFFASVASVVALAGIVAINGGIRRLRRVRPKDLLGSALLGLLNPVVYYIVLFNAYDLLKAQEAQPLNYLWPVIMTVLSIIILKEKVRPRNVIGVLISFTGVMLITSSGLFSSEGPDPVGVVLALSSAMIWSVYWIALKRSANGDEDIRMSIGFLFSIPALAVISLYFGEGGVPALSGIGPAIYVGVFEMGITFFIWIRALRSSRTTAHVANMIYLGPFISLVFIHLVLGERLMITTIPGLALIVLGILMQGRGSDPQS